jgi:hypothetical protein
MDTLNSFSKRSVALACGIVLLPLVAPAQSAAQTPAGSQGPMVVERVTSGFLVEPELKVTSFDHQTSQLLGADGGWLADQIFFIGGGGYWLTDWSNTRQLGYGGLVLGVTTPADNPFSVGFKALIGGGHARVTRGVTVYQPFDGGYNPYQTNGPSGPAIGVPPGNPVPVPVLTNVVYEEGFFVFEPQVSVGFRMSKHVRITAGAGYRFLDNHYYYDGIDGLSGPTASVGVQIIGSGH